MFMQRTGPAPARYTTSSQHLGAWWNNFGDLWGDLTGGGGGGGGGTGGSSGSPVPPPVVSDNAGTDVYFEKIRRWTVDVKAAGHVPTRVPAGYDTTGFICERTTGPGTSDPTHGPPQIYVLAPVDIRDADNHVTAALANDRSGKLLNAMVAFGLAPGVTTQEGNTGAPPGTGTDWVSVAMWSAIGLGTVVIVPAILNAVSPHRR